MSFKYTFSKLTKMGEPHEQYGVAYWGEVNEDLKPVKFNSMNQNITENDTIECEERSEKQSSKGTIYYQLKKVKVVGGDAGPGNISVSVGPSQLDRIEKKLDQLLGLQDKAVADTDQSLLNDIPF